MATPTLLIIDDEPVVRFAIQKYFAGRGYRVDAAEELEEAEALIACCRYDVVISDLRLGSARSNEGLEVLSFVRERCPETRLVLLTAFGSDEVRKAAFALHADAVLHKPIPLEDLEALVARLGQERREMHEHAS